MKRDRAAGSSRTDWTVIGSSGADRVREQSRTYTTGRKGKRKVSVANGILVSDERVAKANPELANLNYDEGERPLRPSPSHYYGTGATLLARESALGLSVPESVRVVGGKQQSTTIDAVTKTTPHYAPNARARSLSLNESLFMTFKSKPDSRDRIAREVVQAQNANDRRKAKLIAASQRLSKRIVSGVWS